MAFRRRHPGAQISSPVDYRGRSLTAAGSRIGKREAEQARRLIQPWQTRAFSYYHQLGEIHYASQFYARSLSSLELYAGEYIEQDDGRKILEPTSDPTAVALLDRIQDPGGGRSGLLGAYGRLMFVAGEAYLLCTIDPDTEEERWEMLSTNELRVIGPNNFMRYKAPSLIAEDYHQPTEDDYEPLAADEAVVYRLWKRDIEFSALADSPMQPVLEIAEELLILTRAVRAQAKSRLAGRGILFIDDKIMPAPLEPAPDEDPAEDPLFMALTTAIITAIADEGSPAAVSPIIVRVPVPEGKKLADLVYHLTVSDPMQLYPETGLRRECIERLAIGLDMPAEVLTGMGDINHWGSWQVDENAWKAHIQPVANQLVDDLTSAYYRPALRAAGVQDPERFGIAYDASAVINHPDRGKDATDLYQARAIGKHAYREAKGFDDEDAPTDDELNEMIGVAVRDGSLALFGIPTVRSGGIEPTAGVIENAQGTSSAPTGAATGADVEKGPPPAPAGDEPLPETVLGSNGSNSAAAARILAAADLGLLRAREVAGNRIRSLAKRDDDALAEVKGKRAGEVAAILGQDRVRALGVASERDLVVGARDLIEDALRLWRLDEDAVGRLVTMIEEHAAKTLYEVQPSPLPPVFANYVSGLLTVAGK